MTINIDIDDQLNTLDLIQCQTPKNINYGEDIDDNIFNIIPTVTIRGLHEQESLKDLVTKKQLIRGYEPSNRVLNKMETRILRFNSNLNNSHTLNDVYSGKHSFQKDDLEFLETQNETSIEIEKLKNSNSTLTSIANFLYPVKNCNDTMTINSVSGSTIQQGFSNEINGSPISEFSIDTSLALEIENTINKQNIALKSSGPIHQEDKTLQITPEGIVYNNEILLSERQRNIRALINKDMNNIQLDVPKYYKDVSRYRPAEESTTNSNHGVSVRNVNNMYSYSQNIHHTTSSVHNEPTNVKLNRFEYAYTIFVQFWIELWKDIKSLF